MCAAEQSSEGISLSLGKSTIQYFKAIISEEASYEEGDSRHNFTKVKKKPKEKAIPEVMVPTVQPEGEKAQLKKHDGDKQMINIIARHSQPS